LFDVADRRLGESRFLAGEDYTVADIAAYAWFGGIYRGESYGDAGTFLSMQDYANVGRWVAEIDARPGARRGRLVNRPGVGIDERHSASDFGAAPSAS
jgi:GST-like protein